MNYRPKIYIALCGLPDCGKSTLVKSFIKLMTEKDVSVDSLCNESIKEMTIRSSQLVCRLPDSLADLVFIDCPGHQELEEEIKSGLSKAQLIILIENVEQNVVDIENYESFIFGLMNEMHLSTKVLKLFSHSKSPKINHYDVNLPERLMRLGVILHRELEGIQPINPLDTSRRILQDTILNSTNPCGMISFGKDSIAMLGLCQELGYLDKIHWYYPMSGFDMDGVNPKFINHVSEFFDIEIEPYSNIPEGWDFNNHTVQEMMLAKGRLMNNLIKERGHDFVLTGIRRDEEGVRAKEKFFSYRDPDGNADLYKPVFEQFGFEFPGKITEGHYRVHPLLDLTEADTWMYIQDRGLPVCSEYFSKNGERFRSLGDKPITTPIKSNARTISEIVEEVTWTLIPERACRKLQDTPGNMETIRSKGFF